MALLKNSKALVLADQVIFSGTGFLMTVLIARYLSISDFGEYSATVLMIYLAVSAISAWSIQVFQVTSDRTREYISFLFWTQFILSFFIVLVLKVCFSVLSLQQHSAELFFGLGFIMYDFSRKIFLSLNKTQEVLILDVFTSFLMLSAFLIFIFQESKMVDNMLFYFTCAYLFSLLYAIQVIRPYKFNVNHFLEYISIHLKHGKWLFLTAISQWWAGNLFVVASGIYLGSAALGALRLGQSLFGVLNVFLQTFENYVLPQSAIRMQQGQDQGIAYIRKTNQKLAFVFIPVLVIIFLFASPILTLAGGSNFTDYGFVLKGLCLLYVFIFLSQPIRFFFRSIQMNNHFFYAYLISLIFAFSTSHWLISTYGLRGVIAGLTASQLILMLYWTLILQLKNIKIWKSYISY